jgi:hypothetical protein
VQKKVAEARLRSIKDEITAHEYGVSKDRVPDIQFLEKVIANPISTEFDREKARFGIKKIRNEDGPIKSMRKSLIKEVRLGKAENVRDISEYVKTHSKYQ